MNINKTNVLTLIVAQLEADIKVSKQAVKVARDTATHKDCLGSSKYETMGTEASYLAKGQGERLLELQRALAYFQQVSVKTVNVIQPLSLICLEDENSKFQTLMLAADAGGLKVLHDEVFITVITPLSPLGRALLGKEEGDVIDLNIAGKNHSYEVLSVY